MFLPKLGWGQGVRGGRDRVFPLQVVWADLGERRLLGRRPGWLSR